MSSNNRPDWTLVWYSLNQNTTPEVSLLRELENCNKTAFLAEESKISEWEMILRNKGVKTLSVGKEILVKKNIGYVFNGWLPRFIFRRVGGLKSSGILEWWDKIFSGNLAKVRTNVKRLRSDDKDLNIYYNTPIKPAFEHNSRAFFLVFELVLEVGLLAFVCFTLENAYFFRKIIFQIVRKLIRGLFRFALKLAQRFYEFVSTCNNSTWCKFIGQKLKT